MSFESDDARAEALAATFEDAVAPYSEAAVEQAPVEPATPAVEPGTTEAPAEDSFRGFDTSLLSSLPPEVQAAVEAERKAIQGEATRKFQEAAELRKQFGDLDPEVARQSVDYVQKLADPEFLIAAHSAMTAELERLGYTKSEANAQAAQAIAEQVYDDEDEGVVPARIEAELNELKAWRAQTEQQREQQETLAYLANEAIRQETAVRQANPEYTEDDMAWVLTLGLTTPGGDLIKANQAYQSLRGHVAKSLLDTKASVPAAISPAPQGGLAEEPRTGFRTLDEAHEAAKEKLANVLANQ